MIAYLQRNFANIRNRRVRTPVHFFLAAITLMSISSPADAQDSPRLRLARELIAAMKSSALSTLAADTSESVNAKPSVGDTSALRELWNKYDAPTRAANAVVEAYAARFTESELTELLAFFRSPLGRRLLEARAEASRDGSQVATIISEHQAEFQEIFMRSLRVPPQ
jgi:hypothetical protein